MPNTLATRKYRFYFCVSHDLTEGGLFKNPTYMTYTLCVCIMSEYIFAGPCFSHPCDHGYCYENPVLNDFFCFCHSGWTGKHCDRSGTLCFLCMLIKLNIFSKEVMCQCRNMNVLNIIYMYLNCTIDTACYVNYYNTQMHVFN